MKVKNKTFRSKWKRNYVLHTQTLNFESNWTYILAQINVDSIIDCQ